MVLAELHQLEFFQVFLHDQAPEVVVVVPYESIDTFFNCPFLAVVPVGKSDSEGTELVVSIAETGDGPEYIKTFANSVPNNPCLVG